MFIEFDLISDDAQIWIYQADRKFTQDEREKIYQKIKEFAGQWSAHNQPLLASGKIEYNQFIVLAVDNSQHMASGCSIDSSVAFIRNLEKEFNINFLDRTKIAFMADGAIFTEQFNEIKKKISEGHILESTLTFNNAITSKSELKSNWIQPVKESWMKRFF